MKILIEGQTVRIDNHDSGSRKEAKWGSGVHVHKVMNSDRYNGAEIIIPLDKRGEIVFRKLQGKTSVIESRLKREINRALKDKDKRRVFVQDVLSRIEVYSLNSSTKDLERILREGARNLASHFNLEKDIIDESEILIDNKVQSFVTHHIDEVGNDYYIRQNIIDKSIIVGSDSGLVNDWNGVKEDFDKK